MKNKVIELLKDDTLSKIEVYNGLLQLLSLKRGLFAIRNFQSGYSDTKYDSIVYETKKEYGITDLEIYDYKPEVQEDAAADHVSLNDANAQNADLSAQNADLTAQNAGGQPDPQNQDPNLAKFYEELSKDEGARTGLKLHEEYPFLDDEKTPDEMKALVTDKFAAYRNFAKNHAALVEGLEENEANEKIYELAKSAVDNFTLEADIKKELDFYKEQGKVLGKHPKLNNLRITQEINELSEADLVSMVNKAQRNASKARVEIKESGESENLTKRLNDWTLREKLSADRLEKEFKKK